MSEPTTISIDREQERERWQCPRGHTDWMLQAGGRIWCHECRRQIDVPGCGYREIQDARLGRMLPAERVEVVAGEQWSSRRWREDSEA